MAKTKMNPKAWEVLKEDEKMALSLQHVSEKSSWQAGEIMEKSHYKYLEIKYRAERFLKIFTEHYNHFDSLIPPYISGDKMVIDYFTQCVEKRRKPMMVLAHWNDNPETKIDKTELNTRIKDTLDNWQKSDNVYNLAMFDLVKEFDRWNNFRILPKDCQEPSAFKRRVKNVQKRRVRLATSLPEISIEKIEALFSVKRKPCVYLPVLHSKKLRVLKTKCTPKVIAIFSELNLYVFKDEETATKYGKLIEAYVSKTKRECQDGLNFWPSYRDIVKIAENYEAIDNIVPNRRFLQLALSKHEFY